MQLTFILKYFPHGRMLKTCSQISCYIHVKKYYVSRILKIGRSKIKFSRLKFSIENSYMRVCKHSTLYNLVQIIYSILTYITYVPKNTQYVSVSFIHKAISLMSFSVTCYVQILGITQCS